ncbi:hypothetical protein CAEBREN_13775 [Caenorhabditis brenneri]|uniref:Uncharacterized protein n=1 Tax=Caenorhabditis brenneri TaxID=135651 RepID=G0MDM0_CAEBE|nr:hypothetical protein CAEBREN_13775 [Caenorhabditis brenneri]
MPFYLQTDLTSAVSQIITIEGDKHGTTTGKSVDCISSQVSRTCRTQTSTIQQLTHPGGEFYSKPFRPRRLSIYTKSSLIALYNRIKQANTGREEKSEDFEQTPTMEER